MKSIRSSIISLVHVTVFFLHFGVSSFPAIFAQVNTCSCYYLHSQIDGDKDYTFVVSESWFMWALSIDRSCLVSDAKKSGIHDTSFASNSPFKFFDRVYHTRNLNKKTWTDLDGIEMHPIFFQLVWNLDGDWPIRRQLASCIPGLSPRGKNICGFH
jgi:hypothetical protein